MTAMKENLPEISDLVQQYLDLYPSNPSEHIIWGNTSIGGDNFSIDIVRTQRSVPVGNCWTISMVHLSNALRIEMNQEEIYFSSFKKYLSQREGLPTGPDRKNERHDRRIDDVRILQENKNEVIYGLLTATGWIKIYSFCVDNNEPELLESFYKEDYDRSEESLI